MKIAVESQELPAELPAELHEIPPAPTGRCLISALIGNEMSLFSIYQEKGKPKYYVNRIKVARQTYLDCMQAASMDRYCPNCMGDSEDAETEHVNAGQEPS